MMFSITMVEMAKFLGGSFVWHGQFFNRVSIREISTLGRIKAERGRYSRDVVRNDETFSIR